MAELVAEPSKLQDKGFSYLLQLIAKGADNDAVDLILSLIDVCVDGPFIEARKNISLQFRGSENQRLIDVSKTLQTGEVVLWTE